jgi:CheY-like chemotaxis protein
VVALNPSLAAELAPLGQATSTVWQRTETVEEAAALVPRSPPDRVVVDIAVASLWATTVAFVQQLSHRVPAISTIALMTTDSLIDRVAIAQAGLQCLLMKPATPAEVWAAATQVKQRPRQQTAQILAWTMAGAQSLASPAGAVGPGRHWTGTADAILQAWGQCFQAFGKDIGILGYWGNGEFIIGLNTAPPEAAQDALNPLLQALRHQIVTLSTGERLQPATICALVSYPAEGQTVQALYRAAIAK